MLHIKMRLLLLLTMTMAPFMAASAAGLCDPLTEYESSDQCCKKCGPGTYMSSFGTCLEPHCSPCGDKEYQDSYITDPMCKLQPYCDPNKNFIFIDRHESKTKRSTCMCKLGFHCSSETCLTCVPHKTCGPGYGVQSKGNHARDTVCEKCPRGTFSDQTSLDASCQKWTQCEDGYHLEKSGTEASDNVCAQASRQHPFWIYIVVGIVAAVIAAVVVILWKRRVNRDAEGKMKDCMESCLGREKEPPKEAKIIIPIPEAVEAENLTQEETPQTPEENELQSLIRSPTMTDNGLASQDLCTTCATHKLTGANL